MKNWHLYSLNTRNRIMLSICWCLALIGFISAWVALDLGYAWIVVGVSLLILVPPTILVWRRMLDAYIMYYIVFVFSLVGYFFMPAFETYTLTFFYSAILSLYFDYRPVLLMGISNIIFTVYFVCQNHATLFQSEAALLHIIPLVSIHILITAALIAQSVIGERLRSTSIRMERMSRTDALTGLNNHKVFYEYLEQLLQERAEGRYRPLQLAIIDIDNFKQINDSYGHMIGDLILKRVSETIKEYTTPDDIVARYGGEEFAIIFTNKTMKQAYAIVESIRKALMRYRHTEADHRSVTVSVGLKEVDKLISRSELFAQTDELLYKAKRSGKNQIAVTR